MLVGNERPGALEVLFEQARACVRCPALVASRTQVVVGTPNAGARVMLVGEAPGAGEDALGLPLVGRAGALLDELLDGLGLGPEAVMVVDVLQCRPPGNRDPAPAEIANCLSWLWQKLAVVRPVVVGTLGNFATKLLRGDPTPVTRLHGRPEERLLGGQPVRLLPLFHPAAALYAPETVAVLRADLAQLPALVELGRPRLPAPEPEPPVAGAPGSAGPAEAAAGVGEAPADVAAPRPVSPEQLGLF